MIVYSKPPNIWSLRLRPQQQMMPIDKLQSTCARRERGKGLCREHSQSLGTRSGICLQIRCHSPYRKAHICQDMNGPEHETRLLEFVNMAPQVFKVTRHHDQSPEYRKDARKNDDGGHGLVPRDNVSVLVHECRIVHYFYERLQLVPAKIVC